MPELVIKTVTFKNSQNILRPKSQITGLRKSMHTYVQGHVCAHTLFVKTISLDFVTVHVHVHAPLCGREYIWGPWGTRSNGRSLRYLPSPISHKSHILHNIMGTVIWLMNCRSEVTRYLIIIAHSILEKTHCQYLPSSMLLGYSHYILGSALKDKRGN